MRTCRWISALSETGSSSCARASSLIPLPMAYSSGGRPGRRRVGRALHQPEECAISLFHQRRDTTLRVLLDALLSVARAQQAAYVLGEKMAVNLMSQDARVVVVDEQQSVAVWNRS